MSKENDSFIFIGTATTLLEIDGYTILTDPTFLHNHKRIHLGGGLFSKRITPPAIKPENLPRIDLILLTHTHEDHWDREASEKLDKDIPIITIEHSKKQLMKEGFTNLTSLKIGESIKFKELKILALPAQHGPKILLPFTGRVIGFGITSSEGKIWVSGDTTGTKALIKSLKEFKPQVGIVYFGGVKAYIFRLTFDAKDAIKVVSEVPELQKIHGVHIDDWTHFRTKKSDLEKKFADSKLTIEFLASSPAEKINLW